MTIKDDLGFHLPKPFEVLPAFIKHWADLYEMQNKNIECFYEENINREPTTDTIECLYIWKNGGNLFSNQQKGINDRYKEPLRGYLENPPTHKKLEEVYLDYKDDKSGGMIWNIFYLHIISKNSKLNKKLEYEYPIFDQHVYRAMCFMKSKELGLNDFRELESHQRTRIFKEYWNYIEFYNGIKKDTDKYFKKADDVHGRKIDRALFLFGKNIKEAPPFKCKYKPKTKTA